MIFCYHVFVFNKMLIKLLVSLVIEKALTVSTKPHRTIMVSLALFKRRYDLTQHFHLVF